MENMTEYQKNFVRMLDSMREEHKGEPTCLGVGAKECEECLLANFCENDICFNAEKIIEIVTRWAKEHPFVTYEQKYEKVFGVKPISDSGEYICPWFLGLKPCKYEGGNGSPCAKCAKDFWNSEYKEPKKEGVGRLNSKHSNLEKQFSALRTIISGDSLDNLFLIGEGASE